MQVCPYKGRQHHGLTRLLAQAHALERLVEDLLSVSRLARGHFAMSLAGAAVDPIVARAVRDLAAASDRVVVVRAGGAQACAMVDAARLRQVLANLLSNADKYSPPDRPVHVSVIVEPEAVRLDVRDFGPGIPEESRTEVFEPFRRLGPSLTRTTRGTGLGLHIARELVEAMHGTIAVAEPAGPGARFVVRLPRAPVVPAQAPARLG